MENIVTIIHESACSIYIASDGSRVGLSESPTHAGMLIARGSIDERLLTVTLNPRYLPMDKLRNEVLCLRRKKLRLRRLRQKLMHI